MKSYKDLLLELHSNKSKECSFSFGRFQPVTIGHQLVFDAIDNSGHDGFIFVSPNKKNPKDNPISVESRCAAIAEITKSNVIDSCHTLSDVIKFLDDNGYTNGTMYVGSDRVESFKDALQGVTIDLIVKQVGDTRSDDSDAVDGVSDSLTTVSGSSLRQYAIDADFDSFKDNIPPAIADDYALGWYNDIRKVNELSHQTNEDILRECYHQGKVFKEGSYVLNESGIIGCVIKRGDNYVGVVHEGGNIKRYWLNQLVEKIGTPIEKDMFATKAVMGGQISYMGYVTKNMSAATRINLIESGLFDSEDKIKVLKTLKNIDTGKVETRQYHKELLEEANCSVQLDEYRILDSDKDTYQDTINLPEFYVGIEKKYSNARTAATIVDETGYMKFFSKDELYQLPMNRVWDVCLSVSNYSRMISPNMRNEVRSKNDPSKVIPFRDIGYTIDKYDFIKLLKDLVKISPRFADYRVMFGHNGENSGRHVDTVKEIIDTGSYSVDSMVSVKDTYHSNGKQVVVLYHGTSLKCAEQIMKEGFNPRVADAERLAYKNYVDDYTSDNVYLTSKPRVAAFYAQRASKDDGDDCVILEVQLNKNNVLATRADEDHIPPVDKTRWYPQFVKMYPVIGKLIELNHMNNDVDFPFNDKNGPLSFMSLSKEQSFESALNYMYKHAMEVYPDETKKLDISPYEFNELGYDAYTTVLKLMTMEGERISAKNGVIACSITKYPIKASQCRIYKQWNPNETN